MPEKTTMEAARRDLRDGKSASTAAGEFVKEEMDHIREGKHGATSTKQAIAIGLSKARRAGVPLGQPSTETTSAETRRKAVRDTERGKTDPATGEEGHTKRGRAREGHETRAPHGGVASRPFPAGEERGKTTVERLKIGFGTKGGGDTQA
jgi:hypothetical protein